ncbi:hypothetical protein LINPERPRIM_LOCUS35338 [Linum perenne]
MLCLLLPLGMLCLEMGFVASSGEVSGDEDLEAAVEEEASDKVDGSYTTIDGVRSFEKEERDVVSMEVGCGCDADEACSDDDDTGLVGLFGGGGIAG